MRRLLCLACQLSTLRMWRFEFVAEVLADGNVSDLLSVF
jgi:hypothetical protein